YLSIRLFFALPLILDRNFSAGEAISGSWKMTRGHFLGLLGVSLVIGLMEFGGVLLCIIGVWVVGPYVTPAATPRHLLVAGTQAPVSRQGLEGTAGPGRFGPDDDY